MKKLIPPNESIMINVERDLRNNIRNINQRFNDNPDIAKLILINPILALEDIGVKLTPEVKQHIMENLRFPKAWKERRAQIAKEIETELSKLKFAKKLPLTNQTRAQLLFDTLNIKRLKHDKDSPELPPDRLKFYRKNHPLITKLAEYEKLKRGRLLFQPKQSYEQYKSGEKQLKWIKAVRFKI